MDHLRKITVGLIAIVVFSFSLPCYAVLEQTDQYLGWQSFTNLSRSDYQKKLDQLKLKSFRPIDIEISSGSKPKFSIVFNKNLDKRKWAIHSQLDNNAFKKKWKKYQKDNYRLVDLESYKKGSKRYYAGIWIKNTENIKWLSSRNISNKEFSKNFKKYSGKGYMPIDIDGYKDGSSTRYSIIWQKPKKNTKWVLKRNLSQKAYSKSFKKYQKKGYRVYDVSAYPIKSKTYYAVIWIKDPKSTKWATRRDMDQRGFKNAWAKYRDLGYRLADVETYKIKKKNRYAGIWLENTKRPDWKFRKSVNKKISDYLSDERAMGFSVGIAIDGKITYLNNWGFADDKNKIAASSRTIYRTASVSKAFTGVLAFALKEDNKLDLNRKTRSYEKRLPKRHRKHTVGDLLANRGKVRHYKSNDKATVSGTKKVYTSAYSASKLFSGDRLVSNKYLYSTHGYTLASAAMEAATNKSFCSLIKSYISQPNNLPSIACEKFDNKVPNRSLIYQRKGSKGFKKLTALSLSWKYPGGGIESSTYDFLRFGIKLDQNKIISKQSVTDMTTRPDTEAWYAYGWNIGNSNGESWYGKLGGQPGANSYIRIVPDKNIVVVLLSNTRGDGGELIDLAKDIANSLF